MDVLVLAICYWYLWIRELQKASVILHSCEKKYIPFSILFLKLSQLKATMYPSATERYIIWHYRTFILEFSYIYLLQALIHVLNLLYFLLFPHHHDNFYYFTISSIVHSLVVIPATFYLHPKAVTTPQFKVSATISPSQPEHFILLATIIGLGKSIYRDLGQ